jgi:hypothetical protein
VAFYLKFIIEQAETNLIDSENIHLILSERTPYTDLELLKTLTKKPVYIQKEIVAMENTGKTLHADVIVED